MKPGSTGGFGDEYDRGEWDSIARTEHRGDTDDQREVVIESGHDRADGASEERSCDHEGNERPPTPPPETVAPVARHRKRSTATRIQIARRGSKAHAMVWYPTPIVTGSCATRSPIQTMSARAAPDAATRNQIVTLVVRSLADRSNAANRPRDETAGTQSTMLPMRSAAESGGEPCEGTNDAVPWMATKVR